MYDAQRSFTWSSGNSGPNRSIKAASQSAVPLPIRPSMSKMTAATRRLGSFIVLHRSRARLLLVVEERVEISRHASERPQQQRDLSTVMHAVNRRVLQQFADGHDVRRCAWDDDELDGAVDVLVPQRAEKVTHLSLNDGPAVCHRLRGWKLARIEFRTTRWAAAPIEPASLSAQHVHERIPDGSIATRNRSRELVVRQSRHHVTQLGVRPVPVVKQSGEIVHSHCSTSSTYKARNMYGCGDFR